MAIIRGTNRGDIITTTSASAGVIGGHATDLGDTITTFNGDDQVLAGSGDDNIHTGNGNDIIDAGAGSDFIDGGRGDDLITTGSGNDTVVLSSNGGLDTITDFRQANLTEQTITFDDLPASRVGNPIPTNYAGFQWDNGAYITGGDYFIQPSGYLSVDPDGNVGLDAFSRGASFGLSGGQLFTLESADVAAAWQNGETVTFAGYRNGAQVANQQVVVGTSGATHVVFNSSFHDLDSVHFDGSGGTQDPNLNGSGDHVVIDNIQVAVETPSQDKIQVNSQTVADGLLHSATAVDGGTMISYHGYQAILQGVTPDQIHADWFVVA